MNKLFITSVVLFLSGCSASFNHPAPTKYRDASDFADAVLGGSGCMGVGNYAYSPGRITISPHGVKEFSVSHYFTDVSRCSLGSFKKELERFCQFHGGEFETDDSRGDWCVKKNRPLFYSYKYGIKEKSDALTENQWDSLARSELGFITKKEYESQVENEVSRNHAKQVALELRKNLRMNESVNASVGDFICTEDLDHQNEYYQGPVYFGGYVEAKANKKLKVRVVWHGRRDLNIVNGNNPDPIIWTSPKGWFHCDKEVIGKLP
ncbi:hypothetical protein [Pantoea ananatis]|jgi:hypothetical protein|uniref:hypothetical protein n=1 Tax=Pantoea ananas TaxID=553 RepID=UPI000F89846F|nr:hypothetical protein [Pantoea ananatis]RQN05261.1 hypothetical protein EHQ51_10470 [Pantoea ananatis]